MTGRDNVRYLIGVAFAVLVFLCGFYALVIYEFALPELIQGAFISLMTLAAQFVFGEALANSVGRRAQQSFEAGKAQQTTTPEIPVETPGATRG